jgi:hypothetical protein
VKAPEIDEAARILGGVLASLANQPG